MGYEGSSLVASFSHDLQDGHPKQSHLGPALGNTNIWRVSFLIPLALGWFKGRRTGQPKSKLKGPNPILRRDLVAIFKGSPLFWDTPGHRDEVNKMDCDTAGYKQARYDEAGINPDRVDRACCGCVFRGGGRVLFFWWPGQGSN